jgi:hypothetical protein
MVFEAFATLTASAFVLLLGSARAACPSAAAPGNYCVGAAETVCPMGAYCIGGAAANIPCSPLTACTVVGLSVQPRCYWYVDVVAGSGVSATTNGVGTNAAFVSPASAWFDPDTSNVYVGDWGSNVVRRISSTGVVTTFAGTGTAGSLNGAALSARFRYPTGVTTKNGVVYVGGDSGIRDISAGTV